MRTACGVKSARCFLYNNIHMCYVKSNENECEYLLLFTNLVNLQKKFVTFSRISDYIL